MYWNVTIGCVSLVALSACGGGGPSGQERYDARNDRIVEIIEPLLDSPLTTNTQLPETGSARYSGAVYGDFGDISASNRFLSADLTLDASFSNNTIDGVANRFLDRDGRSYDGTIDIEGDVTRSASIIRISTDFEGTLVAPDGGTLVLDAALLGQFYGENGEYLGGRLRGQVYEDGIERNISDASFVTIED